MTEWTWSVPVPQSGYAPNIVLKQLLFERGREIDHLTKLVAKERERANAAEAALEDMLEDMAEEVESTPIVIHVEGDLVIEAA